MDRVITYCKACHAQIEWVWQNGKQIALDFHALDQVGGAHMANCPNPDFFKNKKSKNKKEKFMTKAQKELLKDPWWAK